MRILHGLSAAVCAAALGIAGSAPAQEAPDEAAAPSAEKGEKLFTEKCESCHTGGAAPTADVLGEFDRGDFQGKMESHAPMGEIEDLTESELNDIYAYLRRQAGN